MNINYNSYYPIIIQFPPFAGGKFICNCLALSKYAVPQDAEIANYLIQNPDDYDYRFSQVIKTIPETTIEMKKWIAKYEYGDKQQAPALAQLSNSNLNFYLVAHHPTNTTELLKLWKNAKLIILTNFRKFSDIAIKLKSNDLTVEDVSGNYCAEKYSLLKGSDWPTWDEFNKAKFNVSNIPGLPMDIIEEILQFYPTNYAYTMGFDIDNSIFEKTKFLSSIEILYKQLNYDDFNSKLIGDFWQKYINLHIDNNDNV